jgi:hypothetical protein
MVDIPIVTHMAFSTATFERVRLFEILIEHNGILTTPNLCQSLNISAPTARNTMTELSIAGLVDLTGSEEEERLHNITMGIQLRYIQLSGFYLNIPPPDGRKWKLELLARTCE